MPIIIKELFKSDLDQFNAAWWSEKKIEKLNFNFEQIANAGGGPSGPTGFPGDQGPEGDKGPQGPIGNQGLQGSVGSQGADGYSAWLKNQNANAANITLKPNQGNKIHPTTIVAGAFKGDPLYDTGIQVYSAFRAHSNNDDNRINVMFTSDDVANNQVILNLKDPLNDGHLVYTQGFTDASSDTEWEWMSENHILSYAFTPTDLSKLAQISEDNFKIKTAKSNFGTDSGSEVTELQGTVKFNTSTPATGDVAISNTSDGKISWVDPWTLFPGFPLGSIIAMSAEYYTSDNFWLDETKLSETQYLENRDGSGKEGTHWEGWYLCNGKTWKKGAIEFTVPNLNSYDYHIDSDGAGQGDVTFTNSKPALLGGTDIALTITETAGVYSESYTNDDTVDQYFSYPNTIPGYNPKLIYLCYLKETNMTWNTSGSSAPVTLYSINLGYSSTGTAAACAANESTYKVDFDPNSISWSNTGNSLLGYTLYNAAGTATAPSGYYATGNVVRYWSGTAFTTVASCPTYTMFTGRYAASIYNLNSVFNGSYSTSATVYGNASTFEACTQIYLNSSGTSFPATGWYGVVNSSNNILYRRFWSSSNQAFVGATITEDIFNIVDGSVTSPSDFGSTCSIANSPALACDFYSGLIFVYSTSRRLSATQTNLTGIYINYYNASTNEGTEPLSQLQAGYYCCDGGYYRYCYANGSLGTRYLCPI